MSENYDQWIRKISLVVLAAEKGIDLSEFRIRFQIRNASFESPNNAAIRVYNLSTETILKIRGKGEFSRVVLNAGYENGNYGVIFDGTIVQFREGRESNIDTFLDILAMDGDIIYNQGILKESIAKGTTPENLIKAAVKAMGGEGGYTPVLSSGQNTTSLRSTTMFGMGKTHLRYLTSSMDCSWSIQNGKINVLPFKGYLPGEAIELNRGTGVVGVPEQTEDGIKIQCLINPKLRVGGLAKLTNEEFNRLMQRDPNAAALKFDQRAGLQFNTPTSSDGNYAIYSIDYEGDTRGNAWFCHLTCLAVDIISGTVQGVNT